ncbi:MAG: NAD(P)-dependent oxidoreductase [Planctomycetaceae bacterium]
MTAKPKLLIAECQGFSDRALEILAASFEVRLADLDRAGLLREVAACEFLWVRLRNMIDGEIMDAAPHLRAIITNTTGLNHIDLLQAERRKISVVSLKGESEFLKQIRATAEHTIGLTLALLRKIPAAHHHVCEGHWDRNVFKGREIHEKTVGIIGYGRLGKIVAGMFQAFGARVIVNSREYANGTQIDAFPVVELAQLLQQSDIVSLHVNYEPANDGLIGKSELGLMRQSAVLINTARGELIDEDALASALESGSIGGAAIDVVRDEQVKGSASARLVELATNSGRLIMTPHIGGNTPESLSKTEIFLAQKLCEFGKGVRNQ